MSSVITKIKLINYRRFRNYTIEPNNRINVLIGDNEVGKSSILEAIDLVSNGSLKRVETIGLDKLICIESVRQFNEGEREFEELPKLIVELYLSGNFDHTMNGKNNTDGVICDGIRLVCEANRDYYSEIMDSLKAQDDYFPYDYYSIRFSTFADEAYTSYKKKMKSVLIDSANMNTEYATNDFIKRMYMHYTEDDVKERALHKSKYRQFRNDFCAESFKELNLRMPNDKNYAFGLKNTILNFESELMIYEEDIGIESKGTGKQVFIKTDFALERAGSNVDVILIEEPENHLSHTNLRKLIRVVSETRGGQIFITTHNSLISTRLELRNVFIMHENNEERPITLQDLSEETAKYFMKAPPASLIEFVLSNKVILVEGPSEFMLFEKFYKIVTNTMPEDEGIHIMDVRGLSFKRYLEIAKITGGKVAVVTDNDSDVQKNCIDKYIEFKSEENIGIFYEKDERKKTFEIVLYTDNKGICEWLFEEYKNAQRYMLNNKTEAAFALLEEDDELVVPQYIRRAIVWIRQ